jgi:hypothetical protein
VINSKNKEKLHTSRRPDTSKCNTMRYKEYGTQKVRGVGEDKARKRLKDPQRGKNGNHPHQKKMPQSWLDSDTGTTRRNSREVVGLAQTFHY